MDWPVVALFVFALLLMLTPVLWDVRNKEGAESLWTAVVAVSTCFLVAATIYNAYILDVTDHTLRETLEAGNRAWLSPTRYELTRSFEDNEGPQFTARYQNVGRDPALSARIGITAVPATAQTPKLNLRDFPSVNWEALKKIFDMCKNVPVSEIEGTVVFPSTIVERFASSQMTVAYDLERIKSGTDVVVVFSCLSYRTMKQERHTGYCEFLAPEEGRQPSKWSFRSCPVGNFAN